MNTAEQFDAVLSRCHGLFEKKGKDYGTAWRMQPVSGRFFDQILHNA